jgi:hypothetical protein
LPHHKSTNKRGFSAVFHIRIYWFRIRIQHFRLSTNPDPAFSAE